MEQVNHESLYREWNPANKFEVILLEGKVLVTLLIVKKNDNKIHLPDELLNDISLDYITLIPHD